MFEDLKTTKETLLKASTLKGSPGLGNKLYARRNKEVSGSQSRLSVSFFHK